MGKVRFWVDKELCISCGACMAIAPEIFSWDKDGKSKAKEEPIEDESLKNKGLEAQSGCPTGAIKSEEVK